MTATNSFVQKAQSVDINPKQIELADINGWRDLYAAASISFRRDKQMSYQTVANTFVVRCKTIGLRYFNRTGYNSLSIFWQTGI